MQRQRRLEFGIEISVQFLETVAFQVYFPVYAFTYDYMGRSFTVIINGINGRVGALQQFSFGKMTVALSLVGTSMITHMLGHMPSILPWVGGVFLPACFFAYVASRSAKIIQLLRARGTLHEYQELFQGPENEREEEEWAKQYRKRHETRERRYREEYESNASTSMKFEHTQLYELFEVDPGATLDEISRAFRKLALKHHPDRQRSESGKRDAEKLLKKIVAAYQVLRDPAKRAHYDRTGDMS
jgi:DnaJ-domain-containing protein 1